MGQLSKLNRYLLHMHALIIARIWVTHMHITNAISVVIHIDLQVLQLQGMLSVHIVSILIIVHAK